MKPPPEWVIPDARILLLQLERVPAAGRPVKVTSTSCAICRRRIAYVGSLVAPGLVVCPTSCDVLPLSKVRAIFRTPYGPSLGRSMIGLVARTLSGPHLQIWVERAALLDRAEVLVHAQVRLLRLQQAYDLVERFLDPVGHGQGRVRFIPPRGLHEVLVVRGHGQHAEIDPTEILPEETRTLVQIALAEGWSGLSAPF